MNIRHFDDIVIINGEITDKSEGTAYTAGDIVSNNIIVLPSVFSSYKGIAEIESITLFELTDTGVVQKGAGRIFIFNNPDLQLTNSAGSAYLASNDPFSLGVNHLYNNFISFDFADADWVLVSGKLFENQMVIKKRYIQVQSDSEFNLSLAWVTDSTPTYAADNNALYYTIVIRKHYGIN